MPAGDRSHLGGQAWEVTDTVGKDTTSAPKSNTEYISILASLDEEWLKLPLAVMRDVGPAVQTLGGLLNLTNRETFSPVAAIAKKARLPVASVRKHLVTLTDAGWIVNAGRQHTRSGRPRRTATIKITRKATDHLEPFGFLPWWACYQIKRIGRLPWCAKAVLSVVMMRLCSLKATAEKVSSADTTDELVGSIDNMGGADRWRFSLDWICRQTTGLDRKSASKGRMFLNHDCGIVNLWAGGMKDEVNGAAVMEPNWDFAVVVTPCGEGLVSLAFDRRGNLGKG